MEKAKRIFGVSEVNLYIKELMDGEPHLSGIYVKGEISNYKIYPSGHHYFSLKDAEGSIRAVMFKRESSKLRFRPESGMSVIAGGRITVYPRDGQYQLYCDELTPEGAGSLYIAFEQLKDKLFKEGLFDAARKRSLPLFPERIAIVTSPAGAAVRDMIRILGQRYPLAEVLVLPVRVQGEEAPAEIAEAIQYANRYNVADLIITGRGGGSMEDLWAFNDERVARAIHKSRIPVISAVGHEPDVTISDFVADRRAATPSNAAELAVPDRHELKNRVDVLDRRMKDSLRITLDARRLRVKTISEKRIMISPMGYIEEKRMTLDRVTARFTALAERNLSQKRQRFVRIAATLDALSPLKVMRRGYSIVRTENGTLLKSVGQAETGDGVGIEFYDGRLDCVVSGKESFERKE